MKIEFDFDADVQGMVYKEKLPEAFNHLRKLYQLIWCESSYDPYNDATRDFAGKCLPHIQKLNEIFGFKP